MRAKSKSFISSSFCRMNSDSDDPDRTAIAVSASSKQSTFTTVDPGVDSGTIMKLIGNERVYQDG